MSPCLLDYKKPLRSNTHEITKLNTSQYSITYVKLNLHLMQKRSQSTSAYSRNKYQNFHQQIAIKFHINIQKPFERLQNISPEQTLYTYIAKHSAPRNSD